MLRCSLRLRIYSPRRWIVESTSLAHTEDVAILDLSFGKVAAKGSDHSAVCPIALLISAVETRRPNNNGPVCTIILRNPAGPSVIDSATIGRMNESNVAPAQMAAFVVMSFFFADGVIEISSERKC